MKQPIGAQAPGIFIRGEGVAAQCSARLLRTAGYSVFRQAYPRKQLPAVMLNHGAIRLMRDVAGDPTLFRGAHPITRRVVQWGKAAEPVAFPHEAVVLSEADLLAAFPDTAISADPDTRCTFVMTAGKPLMPPAKEQNFGHRMAAAHRVWLKPEADSSTCWIESLADGWLFLIPDSPKSAWLLSVGEDTPGLIRESSLIRFQILAFGTEGGQFPAHPRISAPLSGPGWLACGSAAMSFDPLCGDGTAHSVREAILAAAAIRAIAEGEKPGPVLAHYDARLTMGFARHLHLCRQFYRTGFELPWWKLQIDALEAGVAWCEAKLKGFEKFEYRLEGLDLLRVA